MLLAAYEYKIVFRGTQLHGNADGSSRLLLPSTTSELPMAPELMLLLEHLAESPVTASDIKKFTRCYPVFSQVLQFVMQGWPKKSGTSLSVYSSCKTELSKLDDCLLWGSRVVIPPVSTERFTGTAFCPSRHDQDEILSSNVCLVAWSG